MHIPPLATAESGSVVTGNIIRSWDVDQDNGVASVVETVRREDGTLEVTSICQIRVDYPQTR